MSDLQLIHTPVLLKEVLECLAPGGSRCIMVDANLGEGGHAGVFLNRYPNLILFGVEADRDIAHIARRKLEGFGDRFRLYRMWFDDFFSNYEQYCDEAPDRILFDLGISAFHFKKSGRGFSFSMDEPLDMRLDRELPETAEDIVNSYPEEALADIFFNFGEERYSRRIARIIVNERRSARITRSKALAELIRRAVPASYRNGRIHPATRSFQALRIAVNRELEQLSRGLEGAFRVLKEGGRMAVISFHSLEDRIVKRFFREKNKSCTCPPEAPICICGGKRELTLLNKKPVKPGNEELIRNPASRSARMRAVLKLPGGKM